MAAFDKEIQLREALAAHDTPAQRDRLSAQIDEHFSIWMEVFAADQDMKQRIRNRIVGTDPACFDALGNTVSRPGGRL